MRRCGSCPRIPSPPLTDFLRRSGCAGGGSLEELFAVHDSHSDRIRTGSLVFGPLASQLNDFLQRCAEAFALKVTELNRLIGTLQLELPCEEIFFYHLGNGLSVHD